MGSGNHTRTGRRTWRTSRIAILLVTVIAGFIAIAQYSGVGNVLGTGSHKVAAVAAVRPSASGAPQPPGVRAPPAAAHQPARRKRRGIGRAGGIAGRIAHFPAAGLVIVASPGAHSIVITYPGAHWGAIPAPGQPGAGSFPHSPAGIEAPLRQAVREMGACPAEAGEQRREQAVQPADRPGPRQ